MIAFHVQLLVAQSFDRISIESISCVTCRSRVFWSRAAEQTSSPTPPHRLFNHKTLFFVFRFFFFVFCFFTDYFESLEFRKISISYICISVFVYLYFCRTEELPISPLPPPPSTLFPIRISPIPQTTEPNTLKQYKLYFSSLLLWRISQSYFDIQARTEEGKVNCGIQNM